jgi:hypothetical protein
MYSLVILFTVYLSNVNTIPGQLSIENFPSKEACQVFLAENQDQIPAYTHGYFQMPLVSTNVKMESMSCEKATI